MTIPKYLVDILQDISNGKNLTRTVKSKGLDYKKVANQIRDVRIENSMKSTPHLVAEMIRRKIIT